MEFDERQYNYLRAVRGLLYLKEGLEGFVDECAREIHSSFLEKVRSNPNFSNKMSCGQCTVSNLLPAHASSGNCPQVDRRKCLCCNRNNRRHCPSNICGVLYDCIVGDHMNMTLNWANTDINKWGTDYWEVAKCYIYTKGYKQKSSSQQTDVTGLLNICFDSETIRTRIRYVQNFHKVS